MEAYCFFNIKSYVLNLHNFGNIVMIILKNNGILHEKYYYT